MYYSLKRKSTQGRMPGRAEESDYRERHGTKLVRNSSRMDGKGKVLMGMEKKGLTGRAGGIGDCGGGVS